jgi:hypothetical protein
LVNRNIQLEQEMRLSDWYANSMFNLFCWEISIKD